LGKALDENSPSIEPIHFEQWINYRGKSRDENSSLVYGIQSSTGQVEILGGKGKKDRHTVHGRGGM